MNFAKLFLCLFLFFSVDASAQERGNVKDPFSVTGYKIPRFVSLASDKVFMRTGPGKKYPVKWEYARKNLPVEIVLEFDVWRKIRDADGELGWVHQSLLSGRRFAMVESANPIKIHRTASLESKVMAKAESRSVLKVELCEAGWCSVEASGYSGWIQQKFLWGVYEDEEFN